MKIKIYLQILMLICFLFISLTACHQKAGDSNTNPSSISSSSQSGNQTDNDNGATDPSGNPVDPTGNTSGKTSGDASPHTPDNTSGNTGKPDQKMSYFNVRDYGAKGNGSSNDSTAIQNAINAAKNADGGIVYIPSGLYLMTSGVNIPMGVSLRGQPAATVKKWRKVSDLGTGTIPNDSSGSDWLNKANFSGTWILVDHGAGNIDSHATFELQGNASIYNLGFVHKNTAPVTSKITVYPPAISIKNVKQNPFNRDGMTIENIVLLNAYVGIGIQAGNGKLLDHQNGQEPNLYSLGRMRVHNVTGGCVYRGIIMKGLLDTIDLQDIRFGYTNMEKSYAAQRANNCADFEWYRADGSNATNIFSFGAKYGILTAPAFTNGSSSMRLSKAELTGQYPLYISATGQYEISDCTLTAIDFNNLCTEKKFRSMTVIQDATSVHQPFYVFNKLNLVNKIQSKSFTDSALYISTKRSSATAMVMFSNITFSGWSPDKTDPIIYYETPSRDYSGFASFYNCTFKGGTSNTGMLFKLSSVPDGGLQFNSCNIPQTLISNSTNTDNAVWFN
ncbi:MAG TPA: hypothetical protein DEB10_12835 [Ruminococcaceae bacterium]|nr:hypothetical protein [Oscillospiraceae bacterium]